MDELLQEFLTETTESLNALDLDIVKLEQNPNDTQLISRIFRIVHTVKGNCGFLGLPRLESVAHHAENVLGQYRKGTLTVTPDSVSLILQSIDRIKGIVGGLANTGKEPAGDDKALIVLLDMAAEGGKQKAAEAFAQSAATAEEVAAKTLRVNVDTLEDIMTQVGELVLARNRMQQIKADAGAIAFRQPLQELSQAVAGLHEGVMKARMQPVGMFWSRLPRLVRDIAIDTGKKIRLEMTGGETEIDRQVLEQVRDPLMHLVRNAAGHGIEKPAPRVASGKPPEGVVRLSARHEGGQVVIEVSDDGAGLDLAAIGRKAVEKGIVTQERLATLNAKQIRQFVFAPGFSTAEAVTTLSGRGVGLDVVRSNLEKIGGTVDLSSTAGKGATFTLRIPLTLAILPALIVTVDGDRYALPMGAVREVVRLKRGGPHVLERINNAKVLRLRDRLLPVLSLQKQFGIDEKAARALNPYIVIVAQGAGNFGILVDGIAAAEEIVVKPLSPVMRHSRLFSGNAVLGDGGVALILDPAGIAEAEGIEISARDAPDNIDTPKEAKTRLLVFRAGTGAPCAVALQSVARLEKIPASAVQLSGGQNTVEYRGGIMVLQPFSPSVNMLNRKSLSVLVLGEGATPTGIVVDGVVDIVETPLHIIPRPKAQPGLLGTAVVAGKVMDIADANWFTGAGA